MFGTTLNRTIFSELVRVFLLALGGLTGLFLLAGVVQQASQLGLGPAQIVAIIPLFVPSTLPYTIPATTLFAACVVYGRLAHDNEVVALKAAGVHLSTIIRPALLLGVLTTAATGALYYAVIPQTQVRLQEEALRDPEEVIYNTLRRDRCLRHPTFPYVLFVRDVQGRRLIDVVIKNRAKMTDAKGEEMYMGYDVVFRAREARLRVDVAEGILWIDPDQFAVHNPSINGRNTSTNPQALRIPDFLNPADARTRPGAMTWEELGPRVAELERQREEKAAALAAADRAPAPPTDAAARLAFQHRAGLQAQLDGLKRQVRNVEAEYYMRPALAVGCLVFALIGCPVGLWANRADYLSTFVICFLPTVCVYYPLLLAGSNMGKDGRLPLGLGCWLANIVIGVCGVVLAWRLLRR
ncbi:LptF/LptG family permease [bacterium]|nr:LptF/LptG family permease [bacterium]